MTPNNLRPEDASRNEEEAAVDQLRYHRVGLSLTEEEFDGLRSLIPGLEQRLNRKVVPIGTAAYHVFLRGLKLELEGAAA